MFLYIFGLKITKTLLMLCIAVLGYDYNKAKH